MDLVGQVSTPVVTQAKLMDKVGQLLEKLYPVSVQKNRTSFTDVLWLLLTKKKL